MSSSSTQTNSPLDVSGSRMIRLPIGQLITICTVLIVGAITTIRYANRLENAVERLEREMRSLKAEMVMRQPFYAWVGQFRYDVLGGSKTFPPEPRPFFEFNRAASREMDWDSD